MDCLLPMATQNSRLHKLPWLLFLLLIQVASTTSVTAARMYSRIPRLSLSPDGDSVLNGHAKVSESTLKDFRTFYYEQTLDHFNYRPESYTTFQQRYLINFKYWGSGGNTTAPIFVYFGAEAPIDGDLVGVGFLTDNAALFNALIVFIEHRYYGKSIPFGSRKEAFKNASRLGYFNSAQAVEDYAEIIMHLKKKLHANYSPVIVIGGSYGGMLASWFRLKYPHVALGALASSAPILYFDHLTPQDGYYSVVTKDFREASESCYETIVKSWSEIDELAAAKPNGLSILSKRFNTCNLLLDSSELKDYLETIYDSAAQYNRPPKYPVTVVCDAIDKGPFGEDTLSRIYAAMVAYSGNRSCYVNNPTNASETSVGWRWQRCSEMVMPIGRGNNTMFEPAPFILKDFMDYCKEYFGVSPRPHWITAYYGGQDIELVLRNFGSNIIFSNGLRDPYSSGGVLDNISDSILAVYTDKGSHCLDILPATESDPHWLVRQRKQEIRIIQTWIQNYYADLARNKAI